MNSKKTSVIGLEIDCTINIDLLFCLEEIALDLAYIWS